MERDWHLLERLSKLDDSVCVGVQEVAALTNFAALTIQQRRIRGFPEPIKGPRRLTWHIGQIRAWGLDNQQEQGSKNASAPKATSLLARPRNWKGA